MYDIKHCMECMTHPSACAAVVSAFDPGECACTDHTARHFLVLDPLGLRLADRVADGKLLVDLVAQLASRALLLLVLVDGRQQRDLPLELLLHLLAVQLQDLLAVLHEERVGRLQVVAFLHQHAVDRQVVTHSKLLLETHSHHVTQDEQVIEL